MNKSESPQARAAKVGAQKRAAKKAQIPGAMHETNKLLARVADMETRMALVRSVATERGLLGVKTGEEIPATLGLVVVGHRATLLAEEKPDPNDPVFAHTDDKERRVAEAAYEHRFETKPVAHEHPAAAPEFFKGRPVRYIDNPAELVKGIRETVEAVVLDDDGTVMMTRVSTVEEHEAQLAAKGLKEVLVEDEGQLAEVVVPVEGAKKKPAYEPLGIITEDEAEFGADGDTKRGA